MSTDFEQQIIELLLHAGSARSSALMALQQAKEGNFQQAEALMEESGQATRAAHVIQTTLIGLDEGCGKLPINLITVHAQDHLMNAMVIQDLANNMIDLYRRLPAPECQTV
ncbi:PTS lactose/cellobiose transporter subunit IIA [Xenorhabdus sp. 12]|uniref:PTS lactose/cellobiose transporter subunit IIA n=1 Tax=Xenorhabdus santafensis TaxID=2582833 RepID=A0ABU4S844_9GAMM|nr:PTS lactose/cellobiose transporter subunit IIA [Xenorhabdus sp. 12]MDX7986952.1 PTS lactose/cellobiose transporter subunit IIA [Xenorhabdus sp. 12]